MTKEDALNLISQYCTHLRDISEPDDTLSGLDTRFPDDGSEKKAMRWLGFMQGALYTKGIFSLEELKEHSRTKNVVIITKDKQTKSDAALFMEWASTPLANVLRGRFVAFDATSQRVVVAGEDITEFEKLLDKIDENYRKNLFISKVPG